MKLIETEAEGDEDFGVEATKLLGRSVGDAAIEPGLPAETAHHQFGGEAMVGGREFGEASGMEQFACVSGLTRDFQKNFERGGASARDGH